VLAIGAGVAIPFLIKKKTTSPDESPASVRPKLPKNSYYFDQLGNDVPYGSYYCVFPKPV
jgi:hypothetical protein